MYTQNQRNRSIAMEIEKQRMPVLTVKNVSKRFGGVKALRDASFDLFPGEILAIVGANGAGKSTLMKIVAGVYEPDTGEILVEGEEATFQGIAAVRAAGIEMVYQDLALVKNMDAPYNMFLGRIPTKWGVFVDDEQMARKTREILERLGITTLQNVSVEVNGLSGGQQQALAIGRAVAWGSKVIILDEPTAALGVSEAEQVLQLILDLRDKGSSIIIISHNLDHVFRLADRILVIRSGRSVAEVERGKITIDELVKVITSEGL